MFFWAVIYPLSEVLSQCFWGCYILCLRFVPTWMGCYILRLRSCPNIVGLLYPLFEVLFGYARMVVRRLNLSARPVTVKTSIHSHIFLDNENSLFSNAYYRFRACFLIVGFHGTVDPAIRSR